MNVFDFDKTICKKDSSAMFVRFCFNKHPVRVFQALLTSALYIINAGKNRSTKELKQKVFSFLPYIKDVDSLVLDFWKKKNDTIQPWYLKLKQEDDLIITASPEFIVMPAAKTLGVRLLGTEMDKHTGLIHGDNCHDIAKVKKFRKYYPGCDIDEFYSDSYSDSPLAEIAQSAYIIKGSRVCKWGQ